MNKENKTTPLINPFTAGSQGTGDLVCPTQQELGWFWPPVVSEGFWQSRAPQCGSSLSHLFWGIKMQGSKCWWVPPSLHMCGQTIPSSHVQGSPGASQRGESLPCNLILIPPALPVPTLPSTQAPLTQGWSWQAAVTTVGQVKIWGHPIITSHYYITLFFLRGTGGCYFRTWKLVVLLLRADGSGRVCVLDRQNEGLGNIFFTLCPLCGLQMQWPLVEEVHIWGNKGTCSAIMMFHFTFMGFFPETGIPNSRRHQPTFSGRYLCVRRSFWCLKRLPGTEAGQS